MKFDRTKLKNKLLVKGASKSIPTPPKSIRKTKDAPKSAIVSIPSAVKSKSKVSEAVIPTGPLVMRTKLQQKMQTKLDGSKFRWINEKLYTLPSKKAQDMFKASPDLYSIYHHGFRTQCKNWPVNPVDVLISKIEKKYRKADVADLGCGDAAMEKHFRGSGVTVHSFDLVGSDVVTACDIAHTPLKKEQVDVVVFSLSLMGTNYLDFIKEAWRICKFGGKLMIAEVESRFSNGSNPDASSDAKEEATFITELHSLGFTLVGKVDKSHNVFVIMEFEKVKRENAEKMVVKRVAGEPSLRPCMYKKR